VLYISVFDALLACLFTCLLTYNDCSFSLLIYYFYLLIECVLCVFVVGGNSMMIEYRC